MLKHCAANRKRRLSAFPNVGPYIYIFNVVYIYIYDVKISGFTRSSICKHDINRLRVKGTQNFQFHVSENRFRNFKIIKIWNPLTPNDLQRCRAASPLKIKIPSKNLGRQPCVEIFTRNSVVKGLTVIMAKIPLDYDSTMHRMRTVKITQNYLIQTISIFTLCLQEFG
jgi:hypothetical protein